MQLSCSQVISPLPTWAAANITAAAITAAKRPNGKAVRFAKYSRNVSRYPRQTISSRTGPSRTISTALCQSGLNPIGWWENLDRRTAPAAVEIPQRTQRAVVRQLIRFQATNSSLRFLSLPREEIETRRKPHTSRSPASCRLGAAEDARAEKAGRSSIQNNTSLQHPKTPERVATAFPPI